LNICWVQKVASDVVSKQLWEENSDTNEKQISQAFFLELIQGNMKSSKLALRVFN